MFKPIRITFFSISPIFNIIFFLLFWGKNTYTHRVRKKISLRRETPLCRRYCQIVQLSTGAVERRKMHYARRVYLYSNKLTERLGGGEKRQGALL